MPNLNRDGSEIYYEVHGSGTPLLLTHGYSSTSAMWQGQIEALSKGHKLVVWDMRGHGQSDYPDDPAAYSEALTVADMAALLDEVGAHSAIVGGLSLGGYMSLAFYRAHPERVRALLIIDTGPGFKKDDAREAWNKRAQDTGDRFEREGLAVLKSLSRERSSVTHRDASGHGPYSPPFTATLSNNTPLAFGMDVEDTSRALGTPLTYIRGRPGDEIYLAFRNIGGSGLFNHYHRLYLQFRHGRLAGWKGDWGHNWMWQ